MPGIEGFYTGLVHPFSTPAQALLMLGTGILCGQFAARGFRMLGPVFLAAMLAGLFLGGGPGAPVPWMFGAAAVTGALAALLPGAALPLAVVAALAAGVLVGAASLPDPGPIRDRIITTLGSFVGANLALLYVFGAINAVRDRWGRPWVHIGFRVMAAWVAAIALLMLAVSLAPNATG